MHPTERPKTRTIPQLIAGLAGITGALAVMAAHAGGLAPGQELDWLSRLANQGDAGAQLQLGLAYREGRYGLEPDPRTGLHWLTAAAKGGDAYAADVAANAYAAGQGSPRNLAQARHWWQVAADGGNADAQRHLGELYLEGHQVQQAEPWLRKAADRGDLRAHDDLVQLYRQQEAPASDLHRGENPINALDARMDAAGLKFLLAAWHTVKAGSSLTYSADALKARARQGDPVAEYQLGMRYLDGAWAVEADPQQARRWLQRAAADGNPIAAQTLAEARHNY